MRIGLDGLPLAGPKTGVGHYTFELACGLARAAPADQFELIAPEPILSSAGDTPHRLPANLRATHVKSSWLRRKWWAVGLPLHLKRVSFDLFHGTNYDVPLWGRRPVVVTIHDLSLLLHPATHPEHLVRRARPRLPLMVRAAGMIITGTQSVKREIGEHLRVRPEKIAVTPYAPRRIFHPASPDQIIETKRRLKIEDDFLLFVGTIEPRKNLITLIRALDEILRATSLAPQLVIAGNKGWLTDDLFAYIKSAHLEDRLRFTGYVSDDDLRALYSSCRVSVYPSLYEGFGLPPLEAMACGAPVIASRIPSIMETVGTAACLIAPTDFRALAESIIRLFECDGARRRLSSAGLERAAKFSWEETARLTLDVYHEVLAMNARQS
jgi:glycosyltransferase involved in cell wall biosynthesis